MSKDSRRYNNDSTHQSIDSQGLEEELDTQDSYGDAFPLRSLKSLGEDTETLRSDTASSSRNTKPTRRDDVSEDEDDISVQSFELYTPDEEMRVLRKLDTKLVLFVALLYMLSFLDRSSRCSLSIAE